MAHGGKGGVIKRIGLTGGIATGKSYVRSSLERLGIPGVDADAVVHSLLGPRTPASVEVARRFGPGFILHDGGVNRRALGRLVFSDKSARADLEGIVHPLVFEQIGRWMAERQSSGLRAAVADIPLLFETGHEGDFDLVLVAACRPSEQLRRLMARDRLTEDEARARLAAQWPIERKAALADHVIRTDGTFEETNRQVEAFACNL
ncbi:MAG: dephospho-CoA kinase [Acidobacteria bacterium]|nr:MAG: dephospho-CoA kinase [Acidobacteriota bacterium]